MEQKTIKSLVVVAVSIAIMGCNPLSKMAKNASTVTYDVTPNPLEMHAGKVALSIKGKYPAEYFHKKAVVEVTPIMTWEGGSKEFDMVVLVGEEADGDGDIIKFAGGSFALNDTLDYVKGMEKAEIKIKAIGRYKGAEKELTPLTKIADGTIITPFMVKSDEKPIMAKDNFTKTIPISISGDIHYLVNASNVRGGELRKDDMKAVGAFIKQGKGTENIVFKGVSVSAYASPDGEISKNENLANQRAASAAKSIQAMFRKNRIDAAKADDFFAKLGKGEDWDGFKSAMEASDIKDKELIIRILSMYSDLDKREKEIKNLAATYKEVSVNILPKLRRAQFTINGEETSKTDEQIKGFCMTAPDTLTVEELMYAATLYDSMDDKMKIYTSVKDVYKEDWRGYNNVGYIHIMNNKLDDAKAVLEAGDKVGNSPVIKNNLGIVARWKGNNDKAEELYEAAKGAGPEVNHNIGIVQIMKGDYATAAANLSGESTFNSGLAKVLNGDGAGALKTLDASEAAATVEGYYLKAICGARTAAKDVMLNNLKSAISKDPSYKQKAANDAEFIKYYDDADFQTVAN